MEIAVSYSSPMKFVSPQQYQFLTEKVGGDRQKARQIIAEVADISGITPDQLKSEKRTQSIAKARMYAMWLISKNTTMSSTQIGGMFGDRDHTTVLHAIKVIDRSLAGMWTFSTRRAAQ